MTIDKMTPEQQAECDRVHNEALAIGRSTSPLNLDEAKRVITELYADRGYSPPTFYAADSPADCLRKYQEVAGCTRAEALEQRSNFFEGNQWACVWVWSKFSQDVLGVTFTEEQSKMLDLWYRQWRNCHWWLASAEFVILSERPVINEVDEQGRLHNESGPAIGYKDGYGLWAIHGVRVPKRVIEAPDTLTPQEILGEQNAEVRRVMLARYGTAKFIENIGAKPVHEDEFGHLFRVDIPDDEPLEMVKVIDATPCPIDFPLADGCVLRPDHTNNAGMGYAQGATLPSWVVKERGDHGMQLDGPFYTVEGATTAAQHISNGGVVVEIVYTPPSDGGEIVSPHGVDPKTGLPLRVFKVYWLRVQPGSKTAQEAVASTWRYRETGARVFAKATDYRPDIET